MPKSIKLAKLWQNLPYYCKNFFEFCVSHGLRGSKFEPAKPYKYVENSKVVILIYRSSEIPGIILFEDRVIM